MASLELRLDSKLIKEVGNMTALRDTCKIAIAAPDAGVRVERTNHETGIPRNILITDLTGKKTKEDLIDYVKEYLPWYKFS